MDPRIFEYDEPISWCPGCGNFAIYNALRAACAELELSPGNLVLVSGIGQAAKLPHYFKSHFFNGLHGRALSNATGIKVANPGLTVIAIGGDGDMYGEGGNHFLHTIRRNPDITNLVHNNMVYGLTKGQASPTSLKGIKTPVQPDGVLSEPLNPVALALVLGAGFVARAFCADIDQTKEIIKKAILHKGYALVDIFQPCVSFNKINTYQWFRSKTYYLPEDHDTHHLQLALSRALETERLPLGIFYERTETLSFEEQLPAYKDDKIPLYASERDWETLENWIQTYP